jgi:hypothetical protein
VHWIISDAHPLPKDLTLAQARSWMLRDEASQLRVIGVNSVVYTVGFVIESYQSLSWFVFQGKWILEEQALKFEVVADVEGDKWKWNT